MIVTVIFIPKLKQKKDTTTQRKNKADFFSTTKNINIKKIPTIIQCNKIVLASSREILDPLPPPMKISAHWRQLHNIYMPYRTFLKDTV